MVTVMVETVSSGRECSEKSYRNNILTRLLIATTIVFILLKTFYNISESDILDVAVF